MKPKHHIIVSVILLVCILAFGFTHKRGFGNKDMISWSDRSLVWDDFELVNYMEKDYVALIHSNIACPNLITNKTSKVYAFMNPNLSERLRNEYDSYNVLTHEQYHFNITEYCARLLRKDLVEKGLGGLSLKKIKSLKAKYAKKLDSLQNVYDSITDHNADSRLQRYWELKIDDLLRQTAYYENEDIYGYYDFTKNRTQFFRHIYFTFTHKVLTSFPVAEKDIVYGETYELQFPDHKEKVVKFYKNGKLTNGGYFETAITRIIEKKKGVFEIHYLNADETPNDGLSICQIKTFVDEEKNSVRHYFDKEGKRISRNSIYETKWTYNPEEASYLSTYYDQKGRKISDDEGIYHEIRVLDKKERTILFENFDKQKRLKNNARYIARYELEFNENNRKTSYRLYDENGSLGYHLSDYHLIYDYDERGNTVRVTSLNENGEKTYDDNGASVYEYTYDLFDRETSVKRYNKDHLPIVANDDYFQQVKEYDSLGRIKFEAYYYPEFVLKYNDSKWGATKYSYEADSIVKEHNIDVYGNVIENESKIAIIKKTLDQKKQIIKEIYLKTDGNFARTDDKIVEYRYTYDDKGNTLETSVYDSIGDPKEFEADVALVQWEYDDNRNKLKTTYYNAKNELAYATDSVTYNIYKYNKSNQLVERSNYDINMKPAAISGSFKTSFLINKAGLDSVRLEYDINGKLKEGACITKYYYNTYDNKIRTVYYNASNKRVKNEDGVSAINIAYNQRQWVIGNRYFNEYDQPTNGHDGIAIKKWELNDLGHTISYSYFDKNNNAAMGPNGYHKIAYKWGPMGEVSKTTMYDDSLSLIEDENGTAIYEYTLTPSGIYSEIKRFNHKGELAENSYGVAITQYSPSLNGLYYLDKELNALRETVNDTIVE
ncbi:MAG: hypothetical protein WBG90_08790 [Saonia sp.]